VKVRLHRPEALVELHQQPDDELDVRRAVAATPLRIGLLVLLAEDPQLLECLRALVVGREHPLVAGQAAELHEKPAGQLRGLRFPREQDAVQHLLGGQQVPLADAVEQREDVLFLGMVDVVLDVLQGEGGAGAEEQREALALHPHVAGVVLHHVQEVLHRPGVDADVPLPEEARDPALFLVLEHLPVDLLMVEGHRPGRLLPLVPGDLAVDIAGEAGAQQEEGGLPRRRGQVLHQDRHLFRALHFLHVGKDHQAVPGEQREVAQAEHHLGHGGLPGVEAVGLGRLSQAGGQARADLLHERGLLSLLGAEEEQGRRLARRPGRVHV